jgi:hypothetical protein
MRCFTTLLILANLAVASPAVASHLLGQGFGHVGARPALEAGIQARSGGAASDTLKFSTGPSVRFVFALHIPTVSICGLAFDGRRACETTLARAESGFATGAHIVGYWDENTRPVNSGPISSIDWFTGQSVPELDVSMGAVYIAALIPSLDVTEPATSALTCLGFVIIGGILLYRSPPCRRLTGMVTKRIHRH